MKEIKGKKMEFLPLKWFGQAKEKNEEISTKKQDNNIGNQPVKLGCRSATSQSGRKRLGVRTRDRFHFRARAFLNRFLPF